LLHLCSFVPLRYVQWLHTTPTMILLMSMMSDLQPWRVTAAVAGDLMMVLAGLGASWTSGVAQVGSGLLKSPATHKQHTFATGFAFSFL
jgi:hypothetical protein